MYINVLRIYGKRRSRFFNAVRTDEDNLGYEEVEIDDYFNRFFTDWDDIKDEIFNTKGTGCELEE